MRDSTRSAVYIAEDAVFDETLYSKHLGIDGVGRLADRLFGSEWWSDTVGVVPAVQRARAGATTSYAQLDHGTFVIRLTPEHQHCAGLTHEAAHVACLALWRSIDAADHGPEYRATMLDVTAVMCGHATAARLAAKYRAAGLAVARRHWPEPVVPADRGLYGSFLTGSATASLRTRVG